MKEMRKILLLCLLNVLPSVVFSQEIEVMKGDCTPQINSGETALARGGGRLRLPAIVSNWDASRIYRQPVILVSYENLDFLSPTPRETYDSMLNVAGFNKRLGPGCMADYLREQSGGLFNVVFDVYGPIKVSAKPQPYENPTDKVRNYGHSAFIEATKKAIDSLKIDFTPYDWNNNGSVNQVIFVSAGPTGNVNMKSNFGYLWPNTGNFSTVTTDNGKKISSFSSSAETWNGSSSCGIGTILHEYTHSLGLPDIYPTTSNAGYSILDEWDLMDGGNFTNYGWCPPNYTPLEKMLLGWLNPVELTEPQTVRNMKPSEEGGEVFRIKHSDSEWLLLENKQQIGWDSGLPGKGLLVYHVNYDKTYWSGNTVNNDSKARRFHLIHADNMDYDQWNNYIAKWATPKTYVNSGRMNSNYLSTSPYPWWTDSTTFINDALTDNSVPPAKMFYPNSEGTTQLSKSITNIVQNEDGTITFDFMADVAKCANPTITYENGRILFNCETEGATFVSKVTTSDQMETDENGVSLVTQYVITVYAVAEGHADSDIVTGTLSFSNGIMTGENVDVIDSQDGDVNKDGSVDVADISAVITIMARQ